MIYWIAVGVVMGVGGLNLWVQYQILKNWPNR